MSDGNGGLPPKWEVARAILGKGSLFVHLDPRHAEVQVPTWLRQQPQLVLQVGYQMTIPIHDLSVDEECVYGTLSFSRNPFTCTVPWDSVFALVGDDGRGMVWPESMPPEIAAEVEREAHRSRHRSDRGSSEIPSIAAVAELDERSRKPLTRVQEADDAVRATPLLSQARAEVAPIKRETKPAPKPAPTPLLAPAPTPAASSASASARKRELPPYLRVVK